MSGLPLRDHKQRKRCYPSCGRAAGGNGFTDTKRNDLYAGTPGLNVVKCGLAMAAIEQSENSKANHIRTLHVKTAFLYGKARRDIFFTFPRDITDT